MLIVVHEVFNRLLKCKAPFSESLKFWLNCLLGFVMSLTQNMLLQELVHLFSVKADEQIICNVMGEHENTIAFQFFETLTESFEQIVSLLFLEVKSCNPLFIGEAQLESC